MRGETKLNSQTVQKREVCIQSPRRRFNCIVLFNQRHSLQLQLHCEQLAKGLFSHAIIYMFRLCSDLWSFNLETLEWQLLGDFANNGGSSGSWPPRRREQVICHLTDPLIPSPLRVRLGTNNYPSSAPPAVNLKCMYLQYNQISSFPLLCVCCTGGLLVRPFNLLSLKFSISHHI